MRVFTEWLEGEVLHVECADDGALAWFLYTRHDWHHRACVAVAELLWSGVGFSARDYGVVYLPGRVDLRHGRPEARVDWEPSGMAA